MGADHNTNGYEPWGEVVPRVVEEGGGVQHQHVGEEWVGGDGLLEEGSVGVISDRVELLKEKLCGGVTHELEPFRGDVGEKGVGVRVEVGIRAEVE